MGSCFNASKKSVCLLSFLMVGIVFAAGCLGSSSAVISGGVSDYPENAKIGEAFQISWWVSHPGTMNLTHTAVHYDYASHPGVLGLQAGPAESGYTEILAVPSNSLKEGFNFHAEITPNKTGTMYFRVHSIIGGDNYWSEEFSITVE